MLRVLKMTFGSRCAYLHPLNEDTCPLSRLEKKQVIHSPIQQLHLFSLYKHMTSSFKSNRFLSTTAVTSYLEV